MIPSRSWSPGSRRRVLWLSATATRSFRSARTARSTRRTTSTTSCDTESSGTPSRRSLQLEKNHQQRQGDVDRDRSASLESDPLRIAGPRLMMGMDIPGVVLGLFLVPVQGYDEGWNVRFSGTAA